MRVSEHPLVLKVIVLVVALLAAGGCASSGAAKRNANHIILVGHGIPAKDYPKARLSEFFRTNRHDSGGEAHDRDSTDVQVEQLELEIRNWPRTFSNDPYKFGVVHLAERLREQSGWPVSIAFNEFCAPTLREAIDEAVQRGAARIIVVSTMITPGGTHSEVDIPRSIEEARRQYANVEIVYAWPFDLERVAAMLEDEVRRLDAH